LETKKVNDILKSDIRKQTDEAKTDSSKTTVGNIFKKKYLVIRGGAKGLNIKTQKKWKFECDSLQKNPSNSKIGKKESIHATIK
jgi:hypothetical protein